MQVAEIAPGLWRWTAPHPDWKPENGRPDGWERDVGCVYAETAGQIVLVDPLVPADEPERGRFWRALDRDVARLGAPAVLLTVDAHRRSAPEVAARYGGETWAAEGGEDVGADRVFRPGEALPGGAEAFASATFPGDVVLWLPQHRAVVAGDALHGDGDGGVRLLPADWLPAGSTHDGVRAALAPLLDLPVERVLPAHGEPVLDGAGEALRRALG